MSFCVGCGEAFGQSELVDGDWCEACWDKSSRVKCKRPLKHRPKMKGVLHCKTCANEQGEADDS